MPIDLHSYQAGHLEKVAGYSYFVPSLINDTWLLTDPELIQLLEVAAANIGNLNAYSKQTPDVNMFLALHITNEAVNSSRIEGTQTTIDEAVLPEDEIPPERKSDWKEVINYITALNTAMKDLESLPISSRLLCKAHRLLLNSVRGEKKQPGEFRRSQNWIGSTGLSDAEFIPPHHSLIDGLMNDLENFIHNDQIYMPGLIRIGIAHYQFETIHPFLDGNGRIGRLLITLYLVSTGMLEIPLLYLSRYLDRNKDLYYENLMIVRRENDMIAWLKYFLTAVNETSAEAASALSRIIDFRQHLDLKIHNNYGRRAKSARLLINYLFEKPVITVDQVKDVCSMSYKAANALVSMLQNDGIVKEITGRSRHRLFRFDPYLDSFRL
jgi:cell filamentation protein, protein adenylyltransferase